MTFLERAVPLLICALILALCIEPAFAQTVPGGGTGGASGDAILQWIITNIVRFALGAAVLVGGLTLMFGHHSVAGLGVMVIGGIVVSQWQNIVGLFGL